MIKYKEIQELVESHYDKLFEEMCKIYDDEIFDIEVTVKTMSGLTIKKSWEDRNERLEESGE